MIPRQSLPLTDCRYNRQGRAFLLSGRPAPLRSASPPPDSVITATLWHKRGYLVSHTAGVQPTACNRQRVYRSAL